MRLIITILFLGWLFGCTSSNVDSSPSEINFNDTVKAKELNLVKLQTEPEFISEPYSYDTVLSGGYHLSYRVFLDSSSHRFQSLSLMKGDKEIKEISGGFSYGLPHKNVGYIGADFTSEFVFVHSFGGGNPHWFELIEKETGNERAKGTYLDVDKEKGYFLYTDFDSPEKGKTMILRHIESGREENFEFIDELFKEDESWNRIAIKSLTENELVIEYNLDMGNETKKYYRQQ